MRSHQLIGLDCGGGQVVAICVKTRRRAGPNAAAPSAKSFRLSESLVSHSVQRIGVSAGNRAGGAAPPKKPIGAYLISN